MYMSHTWPDIFLMDTVYIPPTAANRNPARRKFFVWGGLCRTGTRRPLNVPAPGPPGELDSSLVTEVTEERTERDANIIKLL